jgi:hypothetical protein
LVFVGGIGQDPSGTRSAKQAVGNRVITAVVQRNTREGEEAFSQGGLPKAIGFPHNAKKLPLIERCFIDRVTDCSGRAARPARTRGIDERRGTLTSNVPAG